MSLRNQWLLAVAFTEKLSLESAVLPLSVLDHLGSTCVRFLLYF